MAQEFCNYKHSFAINVIERYFGFLKMRWAILRERSFYPIKIQARIVSTCALLHNHIRREMTIDPLEYDVPEVLLTKSIVGGEDVMDYIAVSDAWTQFRDELAQDMWNRWRASRNAQT